MIKDDREYKASKARLDALNQDIDDRRALTKVKTAARRKLRKEIEAYEKKPKVQPVSNIPTDTQVKAEKSNSAFKLRKVEDRLYDKGWKSNPIRRFVTCNKCEKETAELYQDLSEGHIEGHIKARCLKGDNPKQSFSKFEVKLLPTYPCPKCHREMKPKLLFKIACYYCEDCNKYIRLADLLPD